MHSVQMANIFRACISEIFPIWISRSEVLSCFPSLTNTCPYRPRKQVSAAADRPTRRSASRPSCATQMSTVSVINC